MRVRRAVRVRDRGARREDVRAVRRVQGAKTRGDGAARAMSVAIELRYGVERCGGTFPSDGDVGALVERARGAFEGLRGVAAGRLTLLASGGARTVSYTHLTLPTILLV
mgnify:CR=1 FL=1